MHSYQNLTKLFSSGFLPVVVSDSEYVLNTFSHYGFKVFLLSEVYENQEAPEEIILALVDPSASPSPHIFDKTFGNSAILVCPLMSFSGNDDRSIDYFLSRLKEIDFELACERGKKRLEQLQSLDDLLEVSYKKCTLTVELGSHLEVFAPKITPIIKSGEWISVSQFLEIALIPNSDYSCFIANGEFICEGISVAFHRHNYETSGQLAIEAWDIFQSVREQGGFPLKLTLVNSEVKTILTSCGDDILDRIKPLTDEVFHGKLVEVGFASLEPSLNTDWSINSQLNEAAGGVHLALGTGVKAAHIDFISPNAIVTEKAI